MKKRILLIICIIIFVIFAVIISSIMHKDEYKSEEENMNIANTVNEKGATKNVDYKEILNGKSIAIIQRVEAQ